MANNSTVGSVQYDASINLASLKASLKQADRLVEQSYKKQAQSAKKASTSSSSGGASATEAEMRVKNIQREAEETAKSLSKYTPQIQRQFLAVERANNQVYNATVRSSTAIQKYGSDSEQAQKAVNSLNVAVRNQAIAQNNLDTSLKASTTSLGAGKIALTGAAVAAAALAVAIGSNLNNAVARSDTLNNFPRVLQAMGATSEQASEATSVLSERLKGLPTSLDAGTRAIQGFVAAGLPVGVATEGFLALNNAFLASGASTQAVEQSMVQLNQALSRGRIEGEEWNSIVANTPTFLKAMQTETGKTRDELRELYSQSPETLIQDLIRLNTQGGGGIASLDEQARTATDGIATAFENMNNAITRSIGYVIEAIGRDNITSAINGIGIAAENVGRAVAGIVKASQPLQPVLSFLGTTAGAAVLTFSALSLAIWAGTAAMGAFNIALTAVTRHPIIAVISLIAAGIVAVASAVGLLNNETDEIDTSSSNVQANMEDWAPAVADTTKQTKKLNDQIAKINEQMTEANNNYRYALAQLVQQKNEEIATLENTLSEEQRAYTDAFNERKASFEKSTYNELKTHQEKTRALQNQIDFLTKYNTAANAEQLSETQFALARENAEYQKSTELRQAEFDAQTESAKNEYEARRQENQKKLNEELALLNKHRNEVLSVRNVMLLDEIQTLQKQRDEQLKSLRQQRQDIINNLSDSYGAAGTKAGKQFTWKLTESIKQGMDGSTPIYLQTYTDNKGNKQKVLVGGFADGGYTGMGGKNEVAGIVHRGEYVLPKEQVDQNTGLPKAGMGGNITVNLSMSGVMTSSKSDERAIANRMAKLINETVLAKTGQKAIQGV